MADVKEKKTTTKPGLRDFLDAIDDVNDWHTLGIHLRLDVTQLDQIEEQYFAAHGHRRCKTKMIELWLKVKHDASWYMLIKALKKIKEESLAKRLTEKYLSGTSSTTTEEMSVLNELEEKLQSKEKELQRVKKEKEELEIKLKKSEETNRTGPDDEELRRQKFSTLLSRTVIAMEAGDIEDSRFLNDDAFDPWVVDPLFKMKEMLRGQSDPNDPSKPLVPLEVYDGAKSYRELIYSLVPRYINYRNTRLLQSFLSETRHRYLLQNVTDYEKNPLSVL